MKRLHLLQYLVDTLGYKRYLEIGCANDRTFGRINVEFRVGVDPEKGGTERMTSDAFFAEYDGPDFDLVFVDGLHLHEQVIRDVDNSLKHLAPWGCIVLHDCLPATEAAQSREHRRGVWNGDVWRAALELRQRPGLDMATLDVDSGLGVIFHRRNTARFTLSTEWTWSEFEKHKTWLLRVLPWPEMQEWVTGGHDGT